MDPMRENFLHKTEELRPVLREAYQAIEAFQKDRTAGNHRRVLLMLGEATPLLAYFRQYVPADKQGHFVALSEPSLSASDRMLAFDAAVAAMHLDFTVKRAYLHQDSAKLRDVLRASRECGAAGATGEPTDGLVSGRAASPGVGIGEAFVPRRKSDCRHMPAEAVLVIRSAELGLLENMRAASAVVMDCGGAMCHAAITARELGVPCVVGTKEATWRLQPGWKLRVDGSSGAVERVNA